jgi:hypothetical protein
VLRTTGIVAAALLAVTAIGVGATETGRDFLRHLFVPVEVVHSSAQWQAPDGSVWGESTTGRETPYSPEEQEAVVRQFSEIYELQEAGEGRLVALLEGPGYTDDMLMHTVYCVEYTLHDGQTRQIGMGEPAGRQAENLRIAEIKQLRDAGAGEVVEHRDGPFGLGHYTIRFTLSDGATVDVKAYYPPSTLAEREAIFRELRELRSRLCFEVISANGDASAPPGQVWGRLRYMLADGRTVGTIERIPPEVVSEDGRFVIMPGAEETVEVQQAR